MPVIFELTHHMALLPLAALAARHWRGRPADPAWWWLAGAFGVSWVADTAAHWAPPWLVSAVYPVTQAGLVAAVILPARSAAALVAVVVGAGLATVAVSGVERPEILLHTVAWGAVAALLAERPRLGPWRRPLLVYYGLGLLAWWGYVAAPGWPSWLAYQGVRAAGLGWFAAAAWRRGPRLQVVPGRRAA